MVKNKKNKKKTVTAIEAKIQATEKRLARLQELKAEIGTTKIHCTFCNQTNPLAAWSYLRAFIEGWFWDMDKPPDEPQWYSLKTTKEDVIVCPHCGYKHLVSALNFDSFVRLIKRLAPYFARTGKLITTIGSEKAPDSNVHSTRVEWDK